MRTARGTVRPATDPRLVRRATLLAVVAAAGCAGPTEPDRRVVPEFDAPAIVGPPISTAGWEDSGYLTPDGFTMYFTYLRIDPITFLQSGRLRVPGPIRPGWPAPPFDTLGAEIYVARFQNGAWGEPEHLDPTINHPEDLEGGQWVSADGNRILFTNGASTTRRPIVTIYFAERRNGVWTDPRPATAVGYPFLPGDENPHLTQDEQTLFFESQRPGGHGAQDLWMSTRNAGQWSTPVNLGSTVNGPGIEGSPFSLDGVELYWDDKGGGGGISWSYRRADGSWEPRRIAVPASSAIRRWWAAVIST